MRAGVGPYVSAGAALVGASVIAIAPIAPTQPGVDVRVVSQAVSLAADSIANIPQNLINAFTSNTAWQLEGVDEFAAAMASSGNWNVDTGNPNNVWGWDPANPPMLKGLVRMFVPFAPFSDPLGEQMNAWAAANLPMHAGCTFACPDPFGILSVMFHVPIWTFWSPQGYTFGPDGYTPEFNPVGGAPVPWYGKNVQFSPFDPYTSAIDYLLRDPADQPPEFQVKTASAYDVITSYANLARALQITGHLAPWIAVDEIETFFKLFVPNPDQSQATGAQALATSAAAPVQTVTLNVANPPVANGDTTGNQTGNGGPAAAPANDLPNAAEAPSTASQRVTPSTAGALGNVSGTPAPNADQGSGTSTPAADTATQAKTPKLTTTKSINVTNDDKTLGPAQPGASLPNLDGGRTGIATSVRDQVNQTISRITDGPKTGANAKSTTKPSKAGAGNTGK